MGAKKIFTERDKQIVRSYLAGDLLSVIAARYGISVASVSNICRAAGKKRPRLRPDIALRPWPVPGSASETIIRLADGTRTITEISKKIGIGRPSTATLIWRIQRRGIGVKLKSEK